MHSADTPRALHELRKHQIELELQNEELRLAQVALDTARARYFDLYELAPVGYCTLGEAGRILQANRAAAALLGTVAPALVGQALTRFIFRDDQHLYYRLCNPLTPTGQAQSCELRMVQTEGRQVWVHLVATTAQEEAGAPVLRIVLTDISVHKQAALAVQDSEAKYRGLVETAQELVWRCDVEGRFTYLNPAWESTLGYRLEDMLGQCSAPFQRPEVFARYRQELARLLAGAQIRGYMTSWITKDGQELTLLFNAIPIYARDGTTEGAQGTAIDITERKHAEDRQLQSEKSIFGVLECAADAMLISDHQGRLLYANAQAQRLLGYHRIEMLHMTVSDITLPEDRAQMQRLLEMHANTGSLRGELQLQRKDGRCVPVEISGSVLADGNLVASYRDITERRQQEKERSALSSHMDKLSRGLVQAQEEVRRRFSRELHDRTSPNLAALRINLDIITRASPQARTTQEFADRVEDTRALIEDTTFSIRDICAGLHPPALDLGGLLGVVRGYALQFARRTGLQVLVECPHGEVRLAPDLELALFRIIQEALTNAAKHAQASCVSIRLVLAAQPVTISIEDNGIGFDPDALRAGQHGQGLGLLTMRETAEFVGARFYLASAPGHGTRVGLEI